MRAPFSGWKKRACAAERLRDVAGYRRERVERGELRVERGEVEHARVGRDRALGEDRRVPGAVDCGHVSAASLELLRDARGAGEEVEGACRRRSR